MNSLVTPRILAQRIIRLSKRGNQSRDSELEEKEVLAIIVDISSKLLKANIFTERQGSLSRTVPSHYIHTFRKVPVKIKTNGGVNFITLPAKYASLPYNAGVRFIFPSTDDPFKNKPMIPVQSGEIHILEPVLGKMQKQWVYFVEGDEVFYEKRCDKTLCEFDIKFVDVTLIVILGDISPDTPLNVPPELHHDIVLGALDLLGPTYGLQQHKDKINDNNPDALTT